MAVRQGCVLRRPFSQKQLELPKEGLGALFKCSWPPRDHAC